MIPSKLKYPIAVLSVFVLAGICLLQANMLPVPYEKREGSVRATVHEVLNDESAVVVEVNIEAVKNATFTLISDKTDKSRAQCLLSTAEIRNSKQCIGASRLQLILLADHVHAEGTPSPADVIKFTLFHKIGAISTTMVEVGSMPAEAKSLSDVLDVAIKSGEMKYGQPTKLATFKGMTYSLVVTKPD